MPRYLLIFLLVLPLGCDVLGSEASPEYLGMWLSESNNGDYYLHFTEQTLRQYFVSSQDTSCLSRAWKIQDYDPEANVMFFRTAPNRDNEWHVEIRADSMRAGPVDRATFQRTYRKTNEDPRERTECAETERALQTHLSEN